MVKKRCIIPVIMLVTPLVSGYVAWLYEVELSDVCEMAKAENKLVLLYIYDEWTKSADRIFDDEIVSEYINNYFYAMKFYINTSKTICETYNVEKAPVVIFLNGYAEEVGKIEKFVKAEDFYEDMKTIIESKEFREKLKDEAYEALTNADSLYAKGKYKESKEQYLIALDKFQQMEDKEKEEYCKSKISDTNLKIQFAFLKYGLIMFIGIVLFFSLIYYYSKKGE